MFTVQAYHQSLKLTLNPKPLNPKLHRPWELGVGVTLVAWMEKVSMDGSA